MTSLLPRGALGVLALVALTGFSPALAQDGARPADAGELVFEAVDEGLDQEGADIGAYLAARTAEVHGDFREAANWFERALLADPDNPGLIDAAIFARLELGQVEQAAEHARYMKEIGSEGLLADLALLADAARREDHVALLAQLGAANGNAGELLQRLSLGWARLASSPVLEGLKEFDDVGKLPQFAAWGQYHKALALALMGDFEAADAILSGRAIGPISLNRRGVLAHVKILSQLERNAEAQALLADAFSPGEDPEADLLATRLAAGETLAFDTIRSWRDGIAEAFFAVAVILNGEADPAYALMHSQIAASLSPEMGEARLLSATLLERLEQYDLAVEVYGSFTPDQPGWLTAQSGRADALYAADRVDEAIALLRELAAANPQMMPLQSRVAEVLLRAERWEEAIPAFDAALALVPVPEQRNWGQFFSRGIAKERSGDVAGAEADFRRSLELNPGQPEVLNYLGYMLIEERRNLDEALALIQQAVAANPDSGYIIDSLAWAYFRLGRYQDALVPMERASLLEPVEPEVTDHLGDVYWMNGRKREAVFQWKRALSFEPTEEAATRIRRKLEVGLDVVMEEEAGAAPKAQN